MAAILLALAAAGGAILAFKPFATRQYEIAFTYSTSALPGNSARHIEIINLDGTGLRQVTYGTDDYEPKWSPDASSIAYSCDNRICTVNPDGTNLRVLTHPTGSDRDNDPTWSPDGSRIAFTRYENSAFVLLIMNADGSNIQHIPLPTWVQTPTWFPDGQHLAISLSGNQYDIWSSDPDGSNLTALYTGSTYDKDPHLSTDGTRITFSCGAQVCIIPATGGSANFITPTSADVTEPRWTSDNTKIIATCEDGDVRRLCEMNPDGTLMRDFFDPPQGEAYWSDPSPKKLAG